MLDALRTASAELGLPLAQVALAWASAQPGITSLLVGASKLEQLHDNLASLAITLPPKQLKALDEASALDIVFPYGISSPAVNRGIFGGNTVQGWQ